MVTIEKVAMLCPSGLRHESQMPGECFVEFIQKNAKQRRDAREVAQLILHIANDPNPRLRYMIVATPRCKSG